METALILPGLIIFSLTLVIFGGTIIRFVKSWTHKYEASPSHSKMIEWAAQFNHKISPILISIAGPIGGLLISSGVGTHLKYDEIYTPVNHDHFLTIIVLYAVSAIAYWNSILFNEQSTPIIKSFNILGMAQGFILCIFLAIQLGPFSLFGFIPVIITFPLLCPYLFSLLLFIEIRKRFYHFKKELDEEDYIYDSLVLEKVEGIITNEKVENPLIFFLLLPFVALQQAILLLFGQESMSIIKAFTETTTYTFSQYEPPPHPGTGHYLCTIASRGSTWLVKPQRKGIRGGKEIDVNRQLMIANAFEEWLEIHTPRFHRFLRSNYNKVGIPLNNFVQAKWASNLFFILMKPWEWFFLVWLYIFDKNPEKRIQKQYLPSK